MALSCGQKGNYSYKAKLERASAGRLENPFLCDTVVRVQPAVHREMLSAT